MLNDHLEAWRERALGRRSQVSIGRIETLWAQRYAVSVDDLNPLYFDEAYAKQHGYAGLVAPPNYLATLRVEPGAGPFETELLEDGTRLDSRPEMPGLQIMGGGQDLEFHAPVYCGDEIMAETGIESIELKQGRSGQFVMVEERIVYSNVDGELKLTLRNRSLYRVVKEDGNEPGF